VDDPEMANVETVSLVALSRTDTEAAADPSPKPRIFTECEQT